MKKSDVIDDSPIEHKEIRSVNANQKGVCAKCYGRNLAISHGSERRGCRRNCSPVVVNPNQLALSTLRYRQSIAPESRAVARYNGVVEIDEPRTVSARKRWFKTDIVIGRLAELRIIDKKPAQPTNNIPYGATIVKTA
jgi:DNA-directed RNA polymerase subunit beta'